MNEWRKASGAYYKLKDRLNSFNTFVRVNEVILAIGFIIMFITFIKNDFSLFLYAIRITAYVSATVSLILSFLHTAYWYNKKEE